MMRVTGAQRRLGLRGGFACVLAVAVAVLALCGVQAAHADDAAEKTPVPVVAAYAVEEGSTGAWAQVADYAQGQDIPFSVVGTLPADIASRGAYEYWLVAEPDEGLAYVAGSARVEVVREGGAVEDMTDRLTVRLDDGAIMAGAADIVSAVGPLGPLDQVRLTYSARFTGKARFGFAEGNHSFAHIRYAADAEASTRPAAALHTQAAEAAEAAGRPAAALQTQAADEQPSADLERSAQIRTTVYTYRINVAKTAQDSGAPLAGAKFALRDADGLWYAAGGGWAADAADALVVTTDEQGAASFAALDSERYELVETEAPEGYGAVGPVDVELSTDVPEGGAAVLTAESRAAQSISADAQAGAVAVQVADPAAGANQPAPGADQPKQDAVRPAASPGTGDMPIAAIAALFAAVAFAAAATALVAGKRARCAGRAGTDNRRKR